MLKPKCFTRNLLLSVYVLKIILSYNVNKQKFIPVISSINIEQSLIQFKRKNHEQINHSNKLTWRNALEELDVYPAGLQDYSKLDETNVSTQFGD